MNRRELMKSSASAIALMATPAPVLAAVAKGGAAVIGKNVAFAVGTDSGDMDWQFVLAESAEMAETLYAKGNGYECDCADKPDECECFMPGIESQRVPSWDGLGDSGPSAVDWVSAGMSHSCAVCHNSCSSDDDIITIGIRRFIVCEYCQIDATKGEIDLPQLLGVTQ